MLDSIETAPQSTADVVTQTELERQAADELRHMLIAKARRERAEQEAFISAALADEHGARIAPGKLWNRCMAAVLSASRGLRLPSRDLPIGDLTADLLVHAIANGQRREAERGERRANLRRCGCGQPARYMRAIVDDFGNVASYSIPRCFRHRGGNAGRVALAESIDTAGMPRADDCGAHYLSLKARKLLQHSAERHDWTGGQVPDDTADAGRYGQSLDASTLAAALNLNARQTTALQVAMGASLAELAAEQGKQENAVKQAAHNGRRDLAARWTEPDSIGADVATALADVVQAEPLDLDPAERVALAALQSHTDTARLCGEAASVEREWLRFTDWTRMVSPVYPARSTVVLPTLSPEGMGALIGASTRSRALATARLTPYLPARGNVAMEKASKRRGKVIGRSVDLRRALAANHGYREPSRKPDPRTVIGASYVMHPAGLARAAAQRWTTGRVTYSPPCRLNPSGYPASVTDAQGHEHATRVTRVPA